jgi:outer membrane protein assembly factor BamB
LTPETSEPDVEDRLAQADRHLGVWSWNSRRPNLALRRVATILVSAACAATPWVAGHPSAKAADPLPPLEVVPAPAPAQVTPQPASGSALPSLQTGIHASRPAELPWTASAHDVTRTGLTSVVGPDDPTLLGAPWPYRATGAVVAAPAIGRRGVAFVAADDGSLAAVRSDASVDWTWMAGSPLLHTPALVDEPDGSRVVVGSDAGTVAILSAASGQVEWITKLTGSQQVATPVVALRRAGRRVSAFVADASGVVHRLDEDPGGLGPASWSTAAQMVTGNAIALSSGTVFVGGKQTRVLYGTRADALMCLDASTGLPLASSPLSLGVGKLRALATDRFAVYVAGDGYVAAVERDCSQVLWTERVGAGPVAVAAAPGGDGFYVAATSTLTAFLRDPSGTSWQLAFAEHLPSPPSSLAGLTVDGAGTAFLASSDARITAYGWDAGAGGTHLAWAAKLPGASPLPAPSIDGSGRLYAPQGALVHVIDELPAFKVVYEDTTPDQDLRSLREVYGTADPARTIQLTHGPIDESEPSYPRDPGALTWTAGPPPSARVVVGNAAARSAIAYPATISASHASPALSEVSEETGRSTLLDGNDYVAFTDTSGGSHAVRFARVPLTSSSLTVLDASQFAIAQGLHSATAATLAGPNLESSHPVFSPDGTRVAWAECPSGGSGGLVVLDLRGAAHILRSSAPPETGGCRKRAPTFSPDSRWIAYEVGPGIAGIDLDGTSSFSSAPSGGPGVTYSQPTWSPDGSQIAVTVSFGAQRWLSALSGKNYSVSSLPLAFGASHPSYHLSKLPPPVVSHLAGGPITAPSSQAPGRVIEVYGKGFDVIRPDTNLVFFTHPERKAPLQGVVVGARVDPARGLGVLRVRVPLLAGNGPLTVVTGSGSSSTRFVVLPEPLETRQQRSVPGARVRVFGRGFDLSPTTSTRVVFPSANGDPLYARVEGGGLDGDREFLVAVVPDGVVDGEISTESNVSPATGTGLRCTVAACRFTRLHPSVTIKRDDKTLAAYSRQATPGMTLSVEVRDVPVDAFFDTGKHVDLTVEPSETLPGGLDWKLAFRKPGQGPASTRLALPSTTGDAVSATGTAVFARSASSAWDRWGDLDIWLNDADHPSRPSDVLRPLARAYLQTPRLNIPVVIVSGTSGSPLNLTTPGPLTLFHPTEIQPFPSVCTFCFITAQPGPVVVNPPASDARRVWVGPDALNPQPGIESLFALCSQLADCKTSLAHALGAVCLFAPVPCGPPPILPSHDISAAVGYLDSMAFSSAGTPNFPQIGPTAADPLFRSIAVNPALAAVQGFPRKPAYEDLLAFLTGAAGTGNTVVPVDSNGRSMLDRRGVPDPRPLGTGPNGVYLFPYDWRGAMPTQATALNGFITSVLARPEVSSVDTNPSRPGVQPIDRVVLITHSLGGPVARLAYLQRPELTDQVISFGGGFGGVGKTLKILAMGDDWEIALPDPLLNDLADSGWGIAVQPWKVKQLAANWPTAYDQSFNSSHWFDDSGTTVMGRTIDRSVIEVPHFKASSWADMTGYLRGINKTLGDAAVGFWNPPGQPGGVALDDFRQGTGPVFHYRVIGEGVQTDVGARLENGWTMNCSFSVITDPARAAVECPPRAAWWRAITADGDDTVPYKTAIGQSAAEDDRIFVLAGSGTGVTRVIPSSTGGALAPTDCAQAYAAMTRDIAGACGLRHSDLPNYGVSLSLINDILAGRVSSQPQATAAGLTFFKRQSGSSGPSSESIPEDLSLSNMTSPAPAPVRASVRADDPPASASPNAQLELEVRGIVQLRVRDRAGRVLGVSDAGPSPPRLRSDIPGARYEPLTFLGAAGAGNALLYLPKDDDYDIQMTALADTAAEVIARYNRSGISLPPMQLRAGASLSMRITPSRELPRSIEIAIPGEAPRNLALAALDVRGVSDREPPVTVALIEDGVLHVQASDDGAGVRDIWMVIDGRRLVRYTEPVEVKPGEAIAVYASDQAGNYEAPHGPDGAPRPEQAMVALPLDKPGPASAVVGLAVDASRALRVASGAPWIDASIDRTHRSLRIHVIEDRVPRGIQAATIRLAYRGEDAVSGVMVAVERK